MSHADRSAQRFMRSNTCYFTEQFQLSLVHQLIQNSHLIKQPHPDRFIVWRRAAAAAAAREVSDMSNSEVITARLLAFDQMYSYEKRLQTFSEWPFREDCQCTPELVSV